MPAQQFNPLSGTFDLVTTTEEIRDAAVENTIVDGVTDIAPSQNAVFDALALKIDTSEKGAALGVATLDAGGKVPTAQLPNSVMEYLGTWAASTNTPTLTNGTGNAGDVYVASDSGTVNFGAGPITFAAGDWVIYSGTVWEKSINSNAVASVNGFTGAVVLTTTDIAEGANLYFTNVRAQNAITGGASTIVTADLGANFALQSNGSGKVAVSAVTSTELGYLSGVSSSIQTQLGNKANVTLNNLTTTAINADLIFNKSSAVVKTQDSAAAQTENISIQSGATTVALVNSGTARLESGTAGVGSSGDVTVTSGTSQAATGNVFVNTGAKTGSQTGNSGAITIASGAYGSSSNSVSGAVTLQSGNKTSGTNGATGDVTVQTGNTSSTTGSSSTGALLLQSGNVTSASTISTGTVTIRSGNKTNTGNAASGGVSMRSGTAQVGATGTASFGSGDATANTSGNTTLSSGIGTTGTGTITVASGNASANVSGTVTVTSGTGTTGTGAVTVSSGNASAGNSGAVTLQSGTASGTRGNIVLNGAAIDASSTRINNVTDPSSAQDAATKNYVDGRTPLTTKGDLLTHTGSAFARQAVGTDGNFLKADSGQTNGLAWNAPNGVLAIRSITTTDSLNASTDDTAYLSSSSFTLTLPTAAGNAGKVFTIIHNGTSLTQLYTIATVSSQTIYGGGYSATTYILNTVGERLKIQSDGSNWLIIEHNTETGWVSYTPTFSAGFGTVSTSEFYWKRTGDSISIRGSWTNGTVAGSLATITLPGSLTATSLTTRKVVGVGARAVNNTQTVSVILGTGSPSTLGFSNWHATAIDPSTAQNGNAVFGTGEVMFMTADLLPISGWNP